MTTSHSNPAMKLAHNRGSALLTALFIMALVASIASIMAMQQLMATKSTEQLFNIDKAMLYTGGVTAWAKGVLFRNAQKAESDVILDDLPEILPPSNHQQATIAGELYDMQALFNLNNLSENKFILPFQRLIKAVEPTLDEAKTYDIALATHAWIAEKNATIDDGADKKPLPDYDSIYTQNTPSYLSPHQPMASPSELRMVAGMTPALYQKLQPYITALPGATKININTAPAEVLMTLADLSLSNAQAVVDDRKYETFLTVDDFLRHPAMGDHQIPPEQITLSSEFFLVNSTVTLAKHTYSLYSLLQREDNKSKEDEEKKEKEEHKAVKVKVLWESMGGW